MKKKKPIAGKIYICILRHCTTRKIQYALLKRVKEDDCEWRTADDNSKITYEWNVESWELHDTK